MTDIEDFYEYNGGSMILSEIEQLQFLVTEYGFLEVFGILKVFMKPDRWEALCDGIKDYDWERITKHYQIYKKYSIDKIREEINND